MRAQPPGDIQFAIDQNLRRMQLLLDEQLVEEIGRHTQSEQTTISLAGPAGEAFLRELARELCQPAVLPSVEHALQSGDAFPLVQTLQGLLGGMQPVLAILGAGLILVRMGTERFCAAYGKNDP